MTDVPEFSVRGRIGGRGWTRTPVVPREGRVVPREHQRRGDPDLHRGATRRRRRRRAGAPGGARRDARDRAATVLTHAQHGQAAREADDAAPLRRARRLLHPGLHRLRHATSTARCAKRYITRYRLEKKDPNAAISEPVKPIVYYVDPATPKKWVPYIKKGIEDWQLGVRGGRVPQRDRREAKRPQNDPDWSAEDARYSVIRWLPSTTENASGPHVHDPRTGEILEADIQFYHNVQNLAKNWYFVQVGPLDPRAQHAAAARRPHGRADALRRRARGRPHARASSTT